MNWIDFIIGGLLMNAMPHFILGTWNQRMLSAFGFGDNANKIYGILCFVAATSLFIYTYGLDAMLANGIYMGATAVLFAFFFVGWFWKKIFTKKEEA